jgi:hypothetical protein
MDQSYQERIKNKARGRPSTMLSFEQWDLLAPPFGKASFLEGYVYSAPLTFQSIPHDCQTDNNRRAGVLACKKLRDCFFSVMFVSREGF